MASKARELGDRFEQTATSFIEQVQALSESEWRTRTDAEGWTVAATAHHAATSSMPIMAMVDAAATGSPMPPFTPEMLNELNAKHAQDFAGCTRDETLAAMREGMAAAAKQVRGYSDEQLARSAMLPFGMEMTAEQIIENVLIGHIAGHGASIQSAAAAA
jgi:hypothetical protein